MANSRPRIPSSVHQMDDREEGLVDRPEVVAQVVVAAQSPRKTSSATIIRWIWFVPS